MSITTRPARYERTVNCGLTFPSIELGIRVVVDDSVSSSAHTLRAQTSTWEKIFIASFKNFFFKWQKKKLNSTRNVTSPCGGWQLGNS
jgi:hypothetical protein